MQRFTDLDSLYYDDGETMYARATYEELHAAGKLVNLEFRLASKDPRKLHRAVVSRRRFLERLQEMNDVPAV